MKVPYNRGKCAETMDLSIDQIMMVKIQKGQFYWVDITIVPQ